MKFRYIFTTIFSLCIIFIIQASEDTCKYSEIEMTTINAIAQYQDIIKEASDYYLVDPLLAWGVLYVEKTQYELNEWLKFRRGFKSLLTKDSHFFTNLFRWANLSSGFTNIKPEFATETYMRAKQYGLTLPLSQEDIDIFIYEDSVDVAIWLMVLSFRVFIEDWKEHIDLSERPEILATLFNLGYEKSLPHDNPKSGGSFYPIIIAGQLYDTISFGDRVLMFIENAEYWFNKP